MSFKREPTAYTTGFLAVLEAVVGLMVIFDFVDWTEAETAAVLGVGAAVATAFAGIFIRGRVTPVAEPKVTMRNGEEKAAMVVPRDELAALLSADQISELSPTG